MRRIGTRFYADEDGGVLVEATVMITLLFTFVLGSVDFLMALYQWNAAAKAVAVGARIAAVSSPVSSDILALSGLGGGVQPGDAMPSFTRDCDGATSTCTGGSFQADALNTIVYGRGSTACGDSTSAYTNGMCDMFDRITPANVRITYTQTGPGTGLGYAGRPGGPVPTIAVSLQNINFRFFFLPFNNIPIPPMTTTITGEDLRSNFS